MNKQCSHKLRGFFSSTNISDESLSRLAIYQTRPKIEGKSP